MAQQPTQSRTDMFGSAWVRFTFRPKKGGNVQLIEILQIGGDSDKPVQNKLVGLVGTYKNEAMMMSAIHTALSNGNGSTVAPDKIMVGLEPVERLMRKALGVKRGRLHISLGTPRRDGKIPLTAAFRDADDNDQSVTVIVNETDWHKL